MHIQQFFVVDEFKALSLQLKLLFSSIFILFRVLYVVSGLNQGQGLYILTVVRLTAAPDKDGITTPNTA